MADILLKPETRFPVGKIVCVGQNYAKHIKEMSAQKPETPVLFLKPSTSIIKEGTPIVLPEFSSEVHHEVELALLIGKTARNIPSHQWRDHLAGAGIALDLTLIPTKPPVLVDPSLNPAPGYYYAVTNHQANGTVTTPQGTFSVTGAIWHNHLWGMFVNLEPEAVGWDWLQLSLDDGREVFSGRTCAAIVSEVDKVLGQVTGPDDVDLVDVDLR